MRSLTTIWESRVDHEVWRGIPGHEGEYYVSSFGRVLSRVRCRDKILSPAVCSKMGHLSLPLGRGTNGLLVHRLVMLAFAGPCPAGKEVRHLDGDAGNNNLENLEYGTRKENNEDMVYHGKRRLSVGDVRFIRANKGVIPVPELMSRFNVGRTMIYNVQARTQYAHVD